MITATQNATAIVTGASSGIGRAIAKALANEGFHVFVTGRNAERLSETALAIEEKGGRASFEAFDLRNSRRLQAFIFDTVEKTGCLNVMVNAAGVGYIDSIADGDLMKWQDMFETNVIAMLVGSQAAIRAMRKTKSQGHIVSISSYAGRMDASNVYGATKAAVDSICATLRKELQNEAIRVVNIMPGVVATNFGRNFSADFVNNVLKSFDIPANFQTGDVLSDPVLGTLIERASSLFASPDDIAQAVLYAVRQPQDLNISEIVLGPRRDFPTRF